MKLLTGLLLFIMFSGCTAQNIQQTPQTQTTAELKPDSISYNYNIVVKGNDPDSMKVEIKVKEYKETSIPTSSRSIEIQINQKKDTKKYYHSLIESLDTEILELSKYKGKVEDAESIINQKRITKREENAKNVSKKQK